MPNQDLLLRVVQACSQSAPSPLFPAEFAAQSGLDRSALDAALDRLRLGGFIQISDWTAGKGQGYQLTAAGVDAVRNPDLLNRPAPAPEPAAHSTPATGTWERGETVRAALLEPRPPIVTMVLLFANLLMFAAGLAIAVMRNIPVADYLQQQGRNVAQVGGLMHSLGSIDGFSVVIAHEWWRVLSHQFLHGGIFHLAVNMLALYSLGPLVEAMWGSKRFLLLYLASGIFGGVAVVLTGHAAVGASGAILGLLTSLGAWLLLNRAHLPEQTTSAMLSRVGFNLLLMVGVSMIPRVSWEAHLGGAIGGVLMSVALHFTRFRPAWQQALAWMVALALPALALAAAIHYAQPRYLGHRLRDAENYLFERHNRFVLPLLRPNAAPWKNDPSFLPELGKASAESLDRVRPILAEIESRRPTNDIEAGELQNLASYFVAWRELFETLKGLEEGPDRWQAATRNMLMEKRETLTDRRLPLTHNRVLPKFVPLREVEQPRTAPPPNTA